MKALLVSAVIALCGCGDRRVDDATLGNLVYAPSEQAISIDVDRAATEVAELVRALALPHSQISEALGSHRVRASSSVVISREGAPVSKLAEETLIELDGDGAFLATSDNDHDYGRHAIFVDGTLYLRPRFGKYHRRAPANVEEPHAIRNEMFSTVGAYFDLLYSGAELSDRGTATVGGRTTRRIDISKAPAASERQPERLAHRSWRDTVTVDEVAGQVSLDLEGGAPIAATIKGTISYVKDGKPYKMSIEATHAISDIGEVSAIVAPKLEDTVTAPTVLHEVDEQRQLLEGLAPAGDEKGAE